MPDTSFAQLFRETTTDAVENAYEDILRQGGADALTPCLEGLTDALVRRYVEVTNIEGIRQLRAGLFLMVKERFDAVIADLSDDDAGPGAQ